MFDWAVAVVVVVVSWPILWYWQYCGGFVARASICEHAHVWQISTAQGIVSMISIFVYVNK